MKIRDGRKLSPRTLEQIRIKAVRRVQDGESPEKVIKALGLARACIYNWLARYRVGGWQALKSGKSTGRPKKLEPPQIEWIYQTVVLKDAPQPKFDCALWTRKIIALAIRKQFGIELSESSVGRLLRQLGLTCQKPLCRACQQNSAAVQQWKKKDYPHIQKRAKKRGASIYFEDESSIRSDFHSGTTCVSKNRTPAIQATGARFSLNMIGAISPRGELRFMVAKGNVGSDQICEFLQRLMHNAERPVFLIWEGHPAHNSKKVKDCITSFKGQLEVYTLPAHYPELNPAEQVWSNFKN